MLISQNRLEAALDVEAMGIVGVKIEDWELYKLAYAQLWEVLGIQMEEHKLDHLNNSSRGIKAAVNALVNVGNGVEEKQKLCHQYEW
ncbi:hypothetical protein L2E82_16654 [Cichorium intybus]|uniref:Uncharacterized protein n=1 Tax=Cichorium intybus TaxID=13427 RepID=A0ACB9F660_CICIN|nr:hypothetical protein L2E82_16654 [Cichorium intybus]